MVSGCSLYFGERAQDTGGSGAENGGSEPTATHPQPTPVAHTCDYSYTLTSTQGVSDQYIPANSGGTFVCLHLDATGITDAVLNSSWEDGIEVRLDNNAFDPMAGREVEAVPDGLYWPPARPVMDVILEIHRAPLVGARFWLFLDDGYDC